jgi:hypothetical protein
MGHPSRLVSARPSLNFHSLRPQKHTLPPELLLNQHRQRTSLPFPLPRDRGLPCAVQRPENGTTDSSWRSTRLCCRLHKNGEEEGPWRAKAACEAVGNSRCVPCSHSEVFDSILQVGGVKMSSWAGSSRVVAEPNTLRRRGGVDEADSKFPSRTPSRTISSEVYTGRCFVCSKAVRVVDLKRFIFIQYGSAGRMLYPHPLVLSRQSFSWICLNKISPCLTENPNIPQPPFQATN